MNLNKLAIAAFIALLLIPLAAAAEVTIASGSAEIFNDNEDAARNRAVRNALRRALKQEAALFLDTASLMKFRTDIREGLYDKAENFIKSYEALEETTDNKIRRVKVKADIDSDAVREYLEKLHILQSKTRRKRLMTVYNPRSPDALPFRNIAARSAMDAISSKLKLSLFLNLVEERKDEPEQSANKTEEIKECLKLIYNSPGAERSRIACAGLKDSRRLDALAEFEIIPSKEEASQDLAFSYAVATVKMKAYDLSNQKLISNVESSQWQLTDSSQGTPPRKTAISGAAEKAAETAALETDENISRHYKAAGEFNNSFMIIFKNTPENKKASLAEALQKIEGYHSMLPSQDFELFKVQYLSFLDKKRLETEILLKLKKLGIRAKSRELSGNRLLFETP